MSYRHHSINVMTQYFYYDHLDTSAIQLSYHGCMLLSHLELPQRCLSCVCNKHNTNMWQHFYRACGHNFCGLSLAPSLSTSFCLATVFDLSKKQWGVERRRRENRGAEGAEGEGVWGGGVPLPTGEGVCILILKFYLQSNAEKGTSSHGILNDLR